MKTKIYAILSLLIVTALVNYLITYQPASFADELALLLSVLSGGLVYYFLYSKFIQPLETLNKKSVQIIANALVKGKETKHRDEIANADYALNQLSENIQHATEFIRQIESGQLDVTYTGISASAEEKNSELAAALLSMRNQMQQIASKEKERNWVTEGLARFGEILRTNVSEVNSLSYNIIHNLVIYLRANQGGLFLVNEEEASLDLQACYAYDRKKYIQKKIPIGQGLVGQAYLDKDYIYLTEVPDNYITITSGLGSANPGSVLIVPLLVNEQVLGVVELASFSTFPKYQIEFLKKVGESIASTIATAKINERTKQLLNESQQQAEQMKAQEEEMRQNLEELMTTQESQQRLQDELKSNAAQLQLLAELQQAKKVLEAKENELKLTIEKNVKRSNQFKQKMEELDMLMEAKDSQINILKEEKGQLLTKLSVYESNN